MVHFFWHTLYSVCYIMFHLTYQRLNLLSTIDFTKVCQMHYVHLLLILNSKMFLYFFFHIFQIVSIHFFFYIFQYLSIDVLRAFFYIISWLYSIHLTVQWRQMQTQWQRLITACMAPLRWCVYPCDQSHIMVGALKYCAYHWFARLRHCKDLDNTV